MISRIRGKLIKKEENRLLLYVGGIFYQIHIPATVSNRINCDKDGFTELVIYHYLNLGKNRGIPVMIGFIDELERDFFEKFIGVSGIGPRAALKAFDKPASLIAGAIEEGDLNFLTTLSGIGKQKAKQIIAHLQGKVGRFALIKSDEIKKIPQQEEIIREAREILKRLQYTSREVEEMVKKALAVKSAPDNIEELLNEIYRQKSN